MGIKQFSFTTYKFEGCKYQIDKHCCCSVFFVLCQLLYQIRNDLDELFPCEILKTSTLFNIPNAEKYYRLHLTRNEISSVKLDKSLQNFHHRYLRYLWLFYLLFYEQTRHYLSMTYRPKPSKIILSANLNFAGGKTIP